MRLLNALAALSLLAASLPARADTVHLKDGGAFEGKAEEAGPVLRVTLRSGFVEIPREKVARIEKGPCAWEEYEARLGALDAKSPKAEIELALWCRAKGMEPEAVRHAARALALDPESAEAQRLLVRPAAVAEAPRQEEKEEEKEEETVERPVERFEGAIRVAASRPASSGSSPASWVYPVRPGSVWYTSWGTVYGPPLILWGWGWGGRACTVTSTPAPWTNPPCVP